MTRSALGLVSVAGFVGLFIFAAAAQSQQRRTTLPGTRTDSTVSRRAPRGTIDGLVTDTTLAPIQGATVQIVRTDVRVGTGPNGRFRMIDVPSGQYLIVARRVGFRPTSAIVELKADDTLRLSYALERLPTGLEAVVVTEQRLSVRMAEFALRAKQNTGEFMTQEQINRRATIDTRDLLQTFKSVTVSPSYTNGPIADYYAMSKRSGIGGMGGSGGFGACVMQVVLDGVVLPQPFNLNLLPSPKWLAGLEVYAGPATIPPQFAGYNRGCGLILVWTKDDTGPIR
jgi:hypothetical protein